MFFKKNVHTQIKREVNSVNKISIFLNENFIYYIVYINNVWESSKWGYTKSVRSATLKFEGQHLRNTWANILFCFIFQEIVCQTQDCTLKVAW